jgi:predicted nucleotidyltransferase
MPALELAVLDLPERHRQKLQALLALYTPHAQVWAYGSRVNGNAHEGSDLDLVLRNPTDLSQDVEGWDLLKDALQASDLPMLVDVHVWARLPQAFHAHIEAEYVVLQA